MMVNMTGSKTSKILKSLRSKTGLSQKKFAEKFGIPFSTYVKWEVSEGSSGHREPPAYVVNMLQQLVDSEK